MEPWSVLVTSNTRALARTAPRDTATKRYRPTDSLLTFLENL